VTARADHYVTTTIKHSEAVALIVRHHYAKSAANTSVAAYGLFRVRDGALVGAALYLPPTRAAAESVSLAWRSVISLSRLVVAPGEPKNATGLFLAATLRQLGEDDPRWDLVVTWADESAGHTGHIYKVTNWTALGRTAPETYWLDPRTGARVSRQATKSRTRQEMQRIGYVPMTSTGKHKFVFRLRAS
jgi:hypothetical protein